MTTPYEEMARSLCRKLFASVLSQAAYEATVAAALRTAAREAQVRVLCELLNKYTRAGDKDTEAAVTALFARITAGEDL